MANRSVHNHNNNSLHGSTQRNEGFGYPGGVDVNVRHSPRQNGQQQYAHHQGFPPQQRAAPNQPQHQQAGQNGQPPPPQAVNGNAGMSDQRAKSVLREAVDAVVNSFAKHTHGYGRGKQFLHVYCKLINPQCLKNVCKGESCVRRCVQDQEC